MITLPKVFSIPAGSNFAEILARQLWEECAHDPLSLSDIQIYLPNRRSCRAMADAFLNVSNGNAAILPQLTPLGDIDEDDLLNTDLFILDEDPHLTPAIHPLQRQLLLADLVAARLKDDPFFKSFILAGELGKLIDRAHTESVDLDKIDTLVTGELAHHWEQTRSFLSIVTEAWPKYLANNDLSDPAQRRNIVIEKKITALRNNPPKHRVIAAGSTGSIPAVTKLLDVIARLPRGEVILSGFHFDTKTWNAIDETHPHFYHKKLLDLMELDPAAVKSWPHSTAPHFLQTQKEKLISFALQPASIFDLSGANVELDPPQMIVAENQLQEAFIVSLRLREILETDQTALVITPDRLLAQRIRDEMLRWGVAINDSAGESLALKEIGSFLLLLSSFSPNATPMTAMTAILSHSLVPSKIEHESIRKLFQNLIPPQGLSAWANDNALLAQYLESLAPLNTKKQTLKSWIECLIRAAESFSSHEKLWRGDDGEAAATLLSELLHQPKSDAMEIDAYDFDQILRHLFVQQVVRPRYGTHPRIHILSPIEARLQHANHLILCGLNEGVWPAQPAANPWLSRPMLKDLGFGSAERRIGQSALDFSNLFCHPSVMITWSKQRDGAPVSPSRWIQQISAVLEKNTKPLPEADPLLSYAEQWNHTKTQPRGKPEGVSDRKPQKIAVTAVGKWNKDPYSYYAAQILNLRKADMLDREVEARDWGTAAHKIFENFLISDQKTPQIYQSICNDEIKKYPLDPSLKADWENRLKLIGEWLLTQTSQNSQAEEKMEFPFTTVNGITVTLRGRADRIDAESDGIHIIDYKTGTMPDNNDPQLGLLGNLAAQRSGKNISALSYIKLIGKKSTPVEVKELKDVQKSMMDANALLSELLEKHYGRGESYTAVALGTREHDDVRHLKRTQEWSSAEGDEDGSVT